MPLTKLQKQELKKIDAEFRRMEDFSSRNGLPLDKFIADHDYGYIDFSELKRNRIFDRNSSRKNVFEASEKKKQSPSL